MSGYLCTHMYKKHHYFTEVADNYLFSNKSNKGRKKGENKVYSILNLFSYTKSTVHTLFLYISLRSNQVYQRDMVNLTLSKIGQPVARNRLTNRTTYLPHVVLQVSLLKDISPHYVGL